MAQQTYTVSFQHGTKVAIGHNRRIESLADKEAHIDPNGKHESWKDEPIEKAYDRIFGEALKEFNNKQKRKDRRIESYLANVRNNSKLHDQYEAIIKLEISKIIRMKKLLIKSSKNIMRISLSEMENALKSLVPFIMQTNLVVVLTYILITYRKQKVIKQV